MNAFLQRWQTAPQLSLHQLTALDAPPLALIGLAAELGCQSVCLFTHVPDAARGFYPVVGADDVEAVRTALDEAAVSVSNLEVFPLDGGDMDAFEEGLRIGAALGARRATAHVHDADRTTATVRFADFCDRAARHGIEAGLEFNGFSAVRDARLAEAIVRDAARDNGRVVLDMLHLMRSGGGPDEVAMIADLVDFVQLCDGPLAIADDRRWREAVGERALPGTGEFPLAALLAPLRPGTIIDVEVPQSAARKAGVSARDRVSRAVEASRAVLGSL
ncbi:sugar phosphate isomerase/epimerase family protein [Polymorphobacter sp.]|uniref:sugar phosphate isomerase/epimerase family protein n=1 Tax=Polymorphobacter sp. TaxID=1909290 RepID=UPI003F6E7B81